MDELSKIRQVESKLSGQESVCSHKMLDTRAWVRDRGVGLDMDAALITSVDSEARTCRPGSRGSEY